MTDSRYLIGLMSGTSMDGVDGVLVDFGLARPRLLASHHLPIPTPLASRLHGLCTPSQDELVQLADADLAVARWFAGCVEALLEKSGVAREQILAIGSHGQTIRHLPAQQYTLQIGDGNTLAALTGIDTITDFRRKDMALGGQGAPLVPAFHNALLREPGRERVVLNIGGIANISYLPADPDQPVLGFDTGPGNTLMDGWFRRHQQGDYDRDFHWGQQGQVSTQLLDQLLADGYLRRPPPKSTGREHYHQRWLDRQLGQLASPLLAPMDVQATLLALTVNSIAAAIERLADSGELYVCGGGASNPELMSQLERRLPSWQITTTEAVGIDPQQMEALAFAWLADRFLKRLPGNLPSVTGASRPAVLGCLYPAG